MSKALLIAVGSLIVLGCSPSPPTVAAPTAQSQTASKIAEADRLMAAQDYEGAALLYRELLDTFEEKKIQNPIQLEIRQKCTRAMVEAGGFASSYTLWEEMATKNPESKPQAQRMQSRAKRMILQQAQELLQQAKMDLQKGHRSKALATAGASEELLTLVGAEEENRQPVRAFLESVERPASD